MKYEKYSEQTQKMLESIEDFLIQTYGKVNDEWELNLLLLADNIDLYKQCKQSIDENGIFDSESYKKNPLLATCKDLQATITKQIQHFGLSPYAMSKIKLAQEDDTDDYIESLTNE